MIRSSIFKCFINILFHKLFFNVKRSYDDILCDRFFFFKDPTRPKYPWMLPHKENMSGTPEQYVAYSTVPPKIQAWVPPKQNK